MNKVELNLNRLKYRCKQSIDELMLEVDGTIVGDDAKGYFAHKDNGSNILAVAHLDTVQKSKHFARDGNVVFSAKLDDRLGVYTILDFLPQCGVNVDILFTENEESLVTTAIYFDPPKSYNWIVEFDRKGSDVVSYDYDWDDVLAPYFSVGVGTFSDISELEHCGCKAVNIGIGYHDEHSFGAYFVISEYLAQMQRFLKFYHEKKDEFFPHEETAQYTVYETEDGSLAYTTPDGDGKVYESYEEYIHRKEAQKSKWEDARWKEYKKNYYKANDASRIMQCESCEDWFYEIEAIKNARGMHCPWCGQYAQC
jgi:hypothetical protein